MTKHRRQSKCIAPLNCKVWLAPQAAVDYFEFLRHQNPRHKCYAQCAFQYVECVVRAAMYEQATTLLYLYCSGRHCRRTRSKLTVVTDTALSFSASL